MDHQVFKAQTRPYSPVLSKTLFNTFATTEPRRISQFPLSGNQDAPVQLCKRQSDATSELDPLPAKRARLARSETHRPQVEHEKQEPAIKTVETTLQQPKPKPSKQLYASFLRNSIDPVPSYCVESVHTFVSEWLESVGSEREERCRSDSYLHHSGNALVSRYLTTSAPAMDCTLDTHGFLVPSTPTPNRVRSHRAVPNTGSVVLSYSTSASGTSKESSRSLVGHSAYRLHNLAMNNIHLREPNDKFPEHIAELLGHVRQERDSPGPSPHELNYNADLHNLEDNAAESDVVKYFMREIFPEPRAQDTLKRHDGLLMARQAIPDSGSNFKVSTPKPDMLYGYQSLQAFPQQTQLSSMGNTVLANSKNLIFPFFVIEFKGEGGNMWVATNQCLGGSASCVNIAERLNHQLTYCMDAKLINSAAFSMTINGTEARLYISWKHDQLYYTQKVKSFLFQDPAHYLQFRTYVRNIIDWGNNQRLTEIRESLDCLLEESMNRSSVAARSLQSPSDRSVTMRTKSSPPKAQSPRHLIT